MAAKKRPAQSPQPSGESKRSSRRGKSGMSRWLYGLFAVLLLAGVFYIFHKNKSVSCGNNRTASSCEACGVGAACGGECRASWKPGARGQCVSSALDFPYPPDIVPKMCPKNTAVDLRDHNVSIIIPWLAEKWEHMEGTMKSILHFTPDDLIHEIIFISDGNKDTKEAELKVLSSKVKVIALPERQGLIRSKMKGVEVATAPVIVFLEAHCIVNHDWLPPLLQRVKENPRVLAMPSLDGIPANNWYQMFAMPVGHWRYEWNFNLIYTNPGDTIPKDNTEPFASPGTSGGIFAMRRDWFQQLRLFDTGMYEWGGDHMELTMKVWRCGGRIEIVPCSRVGHLFRNPEDRPYDVNVDTVVYNYKRLAELWAKDHLSYFYSMKPEAVNMKLEGMDEVKQNFAELEEKLQCKNLQWYLDNVDLEMKWEMDKICHPYAAQGDPIRCKGQLAPQRWTMTQVIPKKTYLQMKKDLAKSTRESAEL